MIGGMDGPRQDMGFLAARPEDVVLRSRAFYDFIDGRKGFRLSECQSHASRAGYGV
jgi:hypothetical protein